MSTAAPVRDPSILYVSATQVVAELACSRKWWLTWVHKMPQLPSKAQADGVILHSVAERWLHADELGRVPSPMNGRPDGTWQDGALKGQKMLAPVNLYPDGWYTMEERGVRHTLNEPEKARVRMWIDEAEKLGILKRSHTISVEQAFEMPIIPGAVMTGKIDHMEVRGVEDHKTAKNAKYLKQPGPRDTVIRSLDQKGVSPNCVGTEPQMLIYGKVWAEEVPRETWDHVRLAHNQFLKEEPNRPVRQVEAFVSRELIDEFWEGTIKPTAARMLELKKLKTWEEVERAVPGPTEKNACMAFGGCAYRGICGKSELPGSYEARVRLFLANKSTPATLDSSTLLSQTPAVNAQGNQDMTTSPFAARRAAQAARAAGQPTTAPAVTAIAGSPPLIVTAGVAPQTQPATTPQASDGTSLVRGSAITPAALPARRAPWARAGCEACGGTGINPIQQPCMICNALNAKEGKLTSSSFVLANLDDGMLIWEDKARPSPAAAPVVTQAPASMPPPFVAPEQPQTQPAAQQLPTAEPSSVAPVAPTPKPRGRPRAVALAQAITVSVETPTDEATRGRPRNGFILLINAAPCRAPQGRATTILSEVIQEVGAELAKGAGVESFYADAPNWNAFKRRDALCQAAPRIAVLLGGDFVIASGADPDTKALITALEPLADVVIRGTL